jgi:hypothetical protein
LVVGHRPFDGEEPLVVIGDDEEKRRGRFASGFGRLADDTLSYIGTVAHAMALG